MASIYREGKGWAARARTSLHRRYKSGFRTHAEARAWARETESAVAKTKQPKGLGPQQTTLAMALRMYAEDFSVKKKGCVQEVVRINRFLALAQLPRLKAVRKRLDTSGDTPRWSFTLEERPASHAHPLPRPFETHRQARLAARPRSTAARQRLATLPVARIAAYDVNELVKAMLAEGNAPATIRIELALIMPIARWRSQLRTASRKPAPSTATFGRPSRFSRPRADRQDPCRAGVPRRSSSSSPNRAFRTTSSADGASRQPQPLAGGGKDRVRERRCDGYRADFAHSAEFSAARYELGDELRGLGEIGHHVPVVVVSAAAACPASVAETQRLCQLSHSYPGQSHCRGAAIFQSPDGGRSGPGEGTTCARASRIAIQRSGM